MDPALLLIEKYFDRASKEDQDKCLRGQMYWCPCLHFDLDVRLLRIRSIDPLHTKPTELVLSRMDESAFTDVHKPSLNPPLRWDEELVVFRAKRRPVILLSSQTELWSPVRGTAPRPQYLLAVPVYSFHPNHSERFKAKVMIFNYPDLFYLPANPDFDLEESFVNFGQTQVVPREWLKKRRICLTTDAYDLLTAWFNYFASPGEANDLAQLMLLHRKDKLPLLA